MQLLRSFKETMFLSMLLDMSTVIHLPKLYERAPSISSIIYKLYIQTILHKKKIINTSLTMVKKIMNILLIEPNEGGKQAFQYRFGIFRSLSLEIIAALTPPEHDVTILNEKVQTIDYTRPYDLVGISLLTCTANRGYTIADTFRTRGVPVVLGGWHPSALPQEAKTHADAVVIGEAELVWGLLLKDLQQGTLKPYYQADRLAIGDEIPAPRRIGLQSYVPTSIQATRGCPTQCWFCCQHLIEGAHFRPRRINAVIDEITTIPNKTLHFIDSSLTINPTYSKDLFRAMKPLGKRFQCYGNINVLAKDDDLLQYAADAGCIRWFVGIESVVQETIDSMKKETNTVKEYATAFKKVKEHGMMITGLFMLGFDTETPDVFDKTYQTICQYDLDDAQFNILTPHPGTKLYTEFEQQGRLLTKDWSKYDVCHVVFHPKHMSKEDLLQGIRRTTSRYLSMPNIIRRCINTHQLPADIWWNKVVHNLKTRQNITLFKDE